MPLSTAAVGMRTAPFFHEVDARWTMAYSACLGDLNACYLDTTRPGNVIAHPLFAICPEWPVALAARALLCAQGLHADELGRAVHASHDTHVLRLIRPGDRLATTSTILSIEARAPGGFVTECFDTVDAAGRLVCRSFHGMLLRGVPVETAGTSPPTLEMAVPPWPDPEGPTGTGRVTDTLEVPANLAHTYSECARIWNPIHTDHEIALKAGLPGIILQGSATLGLALSALVTRHAGGEPARVRRAACQFRGMVMLPSRLTLRSSPPDPAGRVSFEMDNEDGAPILRRGAVEIDVA